MIVVLGAAGTWLLGFNAWDASSPDAARGAASIRFPAPRTNRPAAGGRRDGRPAALTTWSPLVAHSPALTSRRPPAEAQRSHRGRARRIRRPGSPRRRTSSERRHAPQGDIAGSAAAPAPQAAAATVGTADSAPSDDAAHRPSSHVPGRQPPLRPGNHATRPGRNAHRDPAADSDPGRSSPPQTDRASAPGSHGAPAGRSGQAAAAGRESHPHHGRPDHARGDQPPAPVSQSGAPDAPRGAGSTSSASPPAPADGHERPGAHGHGRGGRGQA